MKVAIGAVAGTIGGPATYAIELAKALVAGFPDDRFTVLTDRPESFASFCETRTVELRSAWEQPLWDHLRVPAVLAYERFDLYHGTKGVLPRRGSTPAVVTIHDLASYVMPQTFRLAQRLHLAWETPWAVSRARAVVVPSESTAADVAQFFPEHSAKTVVTPEAPATTLRPASAAAIAAWRERYKVEKPACGYLGTIQPRKNLDALVDAFLEAAGNRDWKLVIAGRLRPGEKPAFLERDARVVYVGALDDDEIAAFFGSIRCMVSPSAYEGFGLTFIEAMASGCPVVGLRNSSIPEVVGDAGILVDSADASELAPAIQRLMTDDRLAMDLSRRGREQAARFSWNETARRTMSAYRAALEAGP
ncbi:MAG TPA: glycosyltransferase family 1 protein [Candidatus Limnocylindrales bacterium]|nr:glycosyltransferase family 1 protein [Candidatus Limnocylindrales bacterium]